MFLGILRRKSQELPKRYVPKFAKFAKLEYFFVEKIFFAQNNEETRGKVVFDLQFTWSVSPMPMSMVVILGVLFAETYQEKVTNGWVRAHPGH